MAKKFFTRQEIQEILEKHFKIKKCSIWNVRKSPLLTTLFFTIV